MRTTRRAARPAAATGVCAVDRKKKPAKKSPQSAALAGGDAAPLCLVGTAAQPIEVVAGRTGDHVAIFHLLQHVFNGPSAGEFQASHDEPTYDPADRLLARRGERLAGHVQVSRRIMHFAGRRIASARLAHLGVLPEFRGQGIGRRLLAAAERKALAAGAELLVAHTSTPRLLARNGWVVCSRPSFAVATARNLLSSLSADDAQPSVLPTTAPEALDIRLWRQVEQDAVAGLYRQFADQACGAIRRTHDYWRWLVSRHAYDRIYVAVLGREKFELGDPRSRIVGYAALRDSQILELLVAPGHEAAARGLLARACSDAIEHGDASIRLDAPPGDPLFAAFQAAGGRGAQDAEPSNVFMAKLADPLAFLRELGDAMLQRARSADLPPTLELGLAVDGRKHLLRVTRRSAKLLPGKLGRSYLTTDSAGLTSLLLGYTPLARLLSTGQIAASTQVAVALAETLFPRLPVWLPPLDDLEAT